MSVEAREEKEKYAWIKPVIIGLLVIGLWLLSIYIFQFKIGGDWDEKGPIGDSFGAINALFSGLALGGIIYTIFLQREELKKQREELSMTRQEFKDQNKNMELQRFENTFFKLLELHNELVSSIEISFVESHSLHEVKSKYAFKKAANFPEILRSNLEDFTPILGNVHRILKFVDETRFEDSERDNFIRQYHYLKFLRSILTGSELKVIFVIVQKQMIEIDTKKYINKFAFFKHLRQSEFSEDEIAYFKPSAYEYSPPDN